MQSLPTDSFFKKLTELDQQKVHQLYSFKQKENLISNHAPKLRKGRTKTESNIEVVNKKQEKYWYLDSREYQPQNSSNCVNLVNNWLCLPRGVVQFIKTIQANSFKQEISSTLENMQMLKEDVSRKSIIIQIWCTPSSPSFVHLLIEYALPFLNFGKGIWSLVALTAQRRFDLLSLDTEGSILWKSTTPLSKVQLEREQLLRRVFGFSAEKQKEILDHELLAKLQLSSGSIIYFILRDVEFWGMLSNAQLFVQQEILLENIANAYTFSILRPKCQLYQQEQQLSQMLKKLNLKVKREEELSKRERQTFLKSLIDKLQGQLTGKQEELQLYKSQDFTVDEEIGIPSERISMGQERYMHLKRQIKLSKML